MTTASHARDSDCTNVNTDGACLDCRTTAGDPCGVCAGERFHRPNCPNASSQPNLGGCGSCALGIVPCGPDGTLQACDDCVHAGRGFAGPAKTSEDEYAQSFAFFALQRLEEVREILYPADDPEAEWDASTIEDVARALAFLRPAKVGV